MAEWNSNLGQWFSGGTKQRERSDTRRLWTDVEASWARSPLASISLQTAAVDLLKHVCQEAGVTPRFTLARELCVVIELLLKAEDISPLEPDWPLIDENASVAVSVRQMLERRRRWALEFDRIYNAFAEPAVLALAGFLEGLPETGLGAENEDADEAFTIPLIELVDRPAELIERLIGFPYTDATLRYDLFRSLRRQLERNLLIASGFHPSDDVQTRIERLTLPTKQRGKSATELVDLYLAGTPFADLLTLAVPFAMPDEARFEHCHIIGGTGHGKTQLMQRMIHADLVAAQVSRRSVMVIDSQGDLIGKLMRLGLFGPYAPFSLAERLIVIDPSDVEYPAALNLFDAHLARVQAYRPADRERVLNGVIEVYETFFGDLLGAELTQKQGVIFKFLARLMLEIPGATIHTLMQLMQDGRPFKSYMEALDGSARYFFATEFFEPSFAATKKQILKRLWGVLATPAFERMFAQKDNKLDLFQALQDGKIILVSTAKDLLKGDGSALFGRFFIALLTQAALERSTLPEHERTPTTVYVDEAQEYFDDRIETILAQARKYRVGLTLAHQTLDQLSPKLRAALFANTSLKCVGGVSAKDARTLAEELRTTPEFLESMRRRGGRTEFAVWLKHRTPHAVRMQIPLGFLERQKALFEDDLDRLLAKNRQRYCGTLADMPTLAPLPAPDIPAAAPTPAAPAEPPLRPMEPRALASVRALPEPSRPPPAAEPALPGKGGAKHRYLQSLIKELGELQGFRATIEAPLPSGGGQVDVLLERDRVRAAFEVTVTTGAQWEQGAIRKALAAGFDQVALVVAKSKAGQERFRTLVEEALGLDERIAVLTPEDLPDYIAGLAPAPTSSETLTRGYRVRVSHAQTNRADAQARRQTIARVISRSLTRSDD